MAGQQFGLSIRNKTTKAVKRKVWFALERERDEAMAKATLDAEHEFSLDAKDCQLNPENAKAGEWIALP